MALSFVGSGTNTAINGGDVTVTLPSMQEGDVVYAIGANDAGSDPTVSTSGYTSLHSTTGSPQSILARKVQGATPDSTVAFTGGGHSFAAVACLGYVWRGADPTTPEDATTVRNLAEGDPDSPSITTVTDDAVVLTMFAADDIGTSITAPTGYGNQVDIGETDSRDATVGAASKVIPTAGAEDPGAWTTDFSGVSDCPSYTVAIRPAASGTVFNESIGLSATSSLSESTAGTFEASSALSASAGLVAVANVVIDEATGLSATAQFETAGGLLLEDAISLPSSPSLGIDTDVSIEAALDLESSAAMSIAPDVLVDAGITLNTISQMEVVGGKEFEELLALEAISGMDAEGVTGPGFTISGYPIVIKRRRRNGGV